MRFFLESGKEVGVRVKCAGKKELSIDDQLRGIIVNIILGENEVWSTDAIGFMKYFQEKKIRFEG